MGECARGNRTSKQKKDKKRQPKALKSQIKKGRLEAPGTKKRYSGGRAWRGGGLLLHDGALAAAAI
jgi:hypothetical protein